VVPFLLWNGLADLPNDPHSRESLRLRRANVKRACRFASLAPRLSFGAIDRHDRVSFSLEHLQQRWDWRFANLASRDWFDSTDRRL
jgi:hypothetical protein